MISERVGGEYKDRIDKLTEHFFRNEYGKLASVIAGYLGPQNIRVAEDIVQETLLKAVDYWQHNGIPVNPQAWLYTTAKNLTLNILKREKYHAEFVRQSSIGTTEELETSKISRELIADEQLKMMFVCCHSSISEESQICLILKILCGFSIGEIASAFFASKETINKRLVRGRRKLRNPNVNFDLDSIDSERINTVLKAIFLLYNEGYNPTRKDEFIRYDLCLEAIRLCEILVDNHRVFEKSSCYALLALMYLNAARFESRVNGGNSIVELAHQDRTKWNQQLINKGIEHLNKATENEEVSPYLILATISANHCIAASYQETNWSEILSLYNSLLTIQDSPILRLNRCVALSEVEGSDIALSELHVLAKESDISKNHMFHATLAFLYGKENKINKAMNSYDNAIALAENKRDIEILRKKMTELVPI